MSRAKPRDPPLDPGFAATEMMCINRPTGVFPAVVLTPFGTAHRTSPGQAGRALQESTFSFVDFVMCRPGPGTSVFAFLISRGGSATVDIGFSWGGGFHRLSIQGGLCTSRGKPSRRPHRSGRAFAVDGTLSGHERHVNNALSFCCQTHCRIQPSAAKNGIPLRGKRPGL